MRDILKTKVIIGGIGVTVAAVVAVTIGGPLGRDVANIIMIGTVIMVILS